MSGRAPAQDAAAPAWLSERVVARSGIALSVRPLRADDVPRARDFLGRLSPESLHRRALGVVKEVSDEQLAERVRQDWPRALALAVLRHAGPAGPDDVAQAADGAELLGVARFAPSGRPQSGEFAIVVADAWQRQGVGSVLFERLVRAARSAGYRELVGTTYADNLEMIELAASHGFAVGPEDDEPHLRRLTLPL